MEHAIRELAVEAGSGYSNSTYDACAKGDDEDSGMNISVMLGVLIAFVASSARAPLPRRACHAAPHQQPPCPPSAPAVGINIGNNMQALGLKMGTAVGKEKKEYEDSLRSNESDASSAAAAEAAELAAQAHAAKLKAQASLKRLDMASGTSGTRQAPPDAPPSPPPSPSSGDVNAAIESHDYNAPENQPRVSREKSEALDATAVAITNPPHAVPELHTRDSKAGDVMFSAPADFTARMKKAKVLYGVGTVVFFGSTLTVFGAMALAPASILAPIEAVQFPTNVAFARIVNKVAVNAKMVLSSLTILVGLAVIVASGNHANTSYTPADLAEKWENGTWIGYLSGVVLVAAVCHVVWLVYEKARKAERPMPSSDTVLPSLYALSSSMIGSISVLQVLLPLPPLGCSCGSLHLPAGAHAPPLPLSCALQAKCISELLESLTAGINIWGEAMTWIVIVLFLVTVGFWLYRLNSALGLYDPLFIIPAIQAGYIFWATLSAGVYFKDFNCFAAWQFACFALGCGIMFGGLYVLSAASAALERTNHPPADAPPAEVRV